MAHRRNFNTGRYYSHDMGPYAYDWDGYTSLPQNAPRSDSLAGVLPSVTTAGAVVGLASAYHGYKASGGSKIAALAFGALGMLSPLLAAGAVAADTVRFGYSKGSPDSLAALVGRLGKGGSKVEE